MDIDQSARIHALEHRLRLLLQARDRLNRLPPVGGAGAFGGGGAAGGWRGPAQRAYEGVLTQLQDELDAAESALREAIARTTAALSSVRLG